MYLGQQLKYKGLEAIVKALKHVWKKHPDAKAVFIEPKTKYSAKLFSQVTDERILNLGETDLEPKTSAISACECLCVPSTQESFGGVYVEAWAHHKAVIGGKIPAIGSVITDGTDGILSEQDSDQLAEKIIYLLSNPAVCRKMGDAGWAKV